MMQWMDARVVECDARKLKVGRQNGVHPKVSVWQDWPVVLSRDRIKNGLQMELPYAVHATRRVMLMAASTKRLAAAELATQLTCSRRPIVVLTGQLTSLDFPIEPGLPSIAGSPTPPSRYRFSIMSWLSLCQPVKPDSPQEQYQLGECHTQFFLHHVAGSRAATFPCRKGRKRMASWRELNFEQGLETMQRNYGSDRCCRC